MPELKIKVHDELLNVVGSVGEVAQRAYCDDAGIDLYVQGDHIIEAGGFKDLPLGISVELPEGYWAFLTGRSSTLRKRGLLVNTGIIDHGYRGPLFAGVFNLGSVEAAVQHGARVAQLILLPTWSGPMVLVDQLDAHPRGSAGFGSSGL